MRARMELRFRRAILSTAAVLFGRGDYKYVAKNVAEETLWLLGFEGVKSFETLREFQPEKHSIAFPQGGYFVMRDEGLLHLY